MNDESCGGEEQDLFACAASSVAKGNGMGVRTASGGTIFQPGGGIFRIEHPKNRILIEECGSENCYQTRVGGGTFENSIFRCGRYRPSLGRAAV